jgi:hypothetical protein
MTKRQRTLSHYRSRAGPIISLASRFIKRHIGSRTQTSTKKEERMHGDDVHSGITSTGYKVVVNPKVPKLMQKYIGFKVFESYPYAQASDVGGNQNVTTIAVLGSIQQQMTSTASLNLGAAPDLALNGYIGLNPDGGMVGPTALSSLTQIPDQKFLYRQTDLTLRVANLTTLAAEVDIYVLKCVAQCAKLPDVLWSELCNIDAYGTNGLAQPSTGNFVAGASFGYINPSVVGSNPFEYREFKKFWKPLKIHHINLAAAAEEKVHFSIINNQTFDIAQNIELNPAMTRAPATWISGNVTVKYPKGCVAVMMVSRGALIKDTATDKLISYGRTEIGYTVTKLSRFAPIKTSSRKTQPMYGNSNIPLTSLATQAQISILDSVGAPVKA